MILALTGALGVALAAEQARGARMLWEVSVDVVTEASPPGVSVGEVHVADAGVIEAGWVRAFRDGSRGLLVEVDPRSDGVASSARAPLAGLRFEIRAFPVGPPLEVAGLGARAGRLGIAELLDPLWLALTPPAPPRAEGPMEVSWAMGSEGVHPVTWRWDGSCRAGEQRGEQRCGGAVRMGEERLWADGPWIEGATGTLDWVARYERRALVSWEAASRRVVETRWPAGRVRQVWTVHARMARAGDALLPLPPRTDDVATRAGDGRGLVLPDGVVPAPAPPPAEVLPFFAAPDAMDAAGWEALRAVLFTRATLPAAPPVGEPPTP